MKHYDVDVDIDDLHMQTGLSTGLWLCGSDGAATDDRARVTCPKCLDLLKSASNANAEGGV